MASYVGALELPYLYLDCTILCILSPVTKILSMHFVCSMFSFDRSFDLIHFVLCKWWHNIFAHLIVSTYVAVPITYFILRIPASVHLQRWILNTYNELRTSRFAFNCSILSMSFFRCKCITPLQTCALAAPTEIVTNVRFSFISREQIYFVVVDVAAEANDEKSKCKVQISIIQKYPIQSIRCLVGSCSREIRISNSEHISVVCGAFEIVCSYVDGIDKTVNLSAKIFLSLART